MIKIMALWSLVVESGFAELEIRSYLVSLDDLETLAIESLRNEVVDDPFEKDVEPDDQFDLSRATLEKAGFSSRFLKESKKLLDASKMIEAIVGQVFSGKAVYDKSGEQLVMQAEPEVHNVLGTLLRTYMALSVRTTVSVYDLGKSEENSVVWVSSGPPSDARLLGSLSLAGIPGQSSSTKSDGGQLELEIETQYDTDFDLIENRFTFTSRLKDTSFSLMTGLNVPAGVYWICELARTEKGKRIALVIRQDYLTERGVSLNESFLKEEGGPFLADERIRELEKQDDPQPKVWDLSQPYQVFEVPLDLSGALLPDRFTTHPSINSGKTPLEDFRELLEKNGIEFRDGDFAFRGLGGGRQRGARLYARLTEKNLRLLDKIVQAARTQYPKTLHLRLSEGDKDGRVLRELFAPAYPGQTASFTWGDGLAIEVEGQVDDDDYLGELRATVSRGKDKDSRTLLKTGVTVEPGQPVEVYSSSDGENVERWFLGVEVVRVPPLAVELKGKQKK